MRLLRSSLSLILLILAEIAVGILLFVNPEEFTRTVLTLFGIIMLLVGLVSCVRFFRDRKDGMESPLTLIFAVAALVIGIFCAFATSFVLGLFSVVAVIYGVILILAGIYKAQTYFQNKKAKLRPSFLVLLSAVLAVILGAVIVFNPFTTTVMLWRFAGISMIAEAVIDLIALIPAKEKT